MRDKTIEVIIGEAFEPHLPQLIALDREVLPEMYVTSEEKLRDRFLANPDSIVGLIGLESGALLGYVNIFPITSQARRALLEGELPNDIEMTSEHVAEWSQRAPTDLYVITVAVSPSARGGQVTRRLVQELRSFLRAQRDAGHVLGAVYTSVVTEDGARFMGRLGFTPTGSEGGCWRVSAEELAQG